VVTLGTAQILAWGSSHYLPAVLAAPMARSLDLDEATAFAAFSVALGVTALTGPWAGRAIDRLGGRPVLMAASLVFALGLTVLGLAAHAWMLFAGWMLMGIGMGSGLYEAAFATLVRLYGPQARNAITGVTLFGGFASTVGWPLSAWLEAHWGWREACFAWAALHLLLGLPLNARLPRAAAVPARHGPGGGAAPATTPEAPAAAARARVTGALLAFTFACTWFVTTAMAAHLPRVLQAAGVGLATAVALGALVGPAQVAGRLLEFGLLRRLHPLLAARMAALAHPLGAALLLSAGAATAPLFAVLHGAGNGILTIAMGTLPLALFGARGYGARQGWLMLPARAVQALSPFLFGLALQRLGAAALGLSLALGLCAFGALMLLRTPATASPAPAARQEARGARPS
jgi:predicted MFS family arabinose efflux permease